MVKRVSKIFTVYSMWLIYCVSAIFFTGMLSAQNQSIADSLESIYLDGVEPDIELSILNKLVIRLNDSKKKLKYSQELIDLASDKDSLHYLYSAYLERGNAFFYKGEMTSAIESFIKSAEYASREGSERRLITAIQNLISTSP